jgi:hypothetical protein
LLILQQILNNPPEPNEALKNAYKKYKESTNETPQVSDNPEIKPEETKEEPAVEDKLNSSPQNVAEMMLTTNDDIISSIPADDEISNWDLAIDDTPEDVVELEETPSPENNFQTMMDEIIERKKTREELLIEIMQGDQELGLYDEPFDNIEPKEIDLVDEEIESTDTIEDTYNIAQAIQNEITPALSDEEVNDMVMDEWEKKFDMDDEEENIFQEEPTNDDEEQNFSTIEANDANFFQEDIDTVVYEPQVEKFNIDDAYAPKEDTDMAEAQQNTFWRDHLNDIEEDLKKK